MGAIHQRLRIISLVFGIALFWGGSGFAQKIIPDVHYEPTPQHFVEEMLKMAEVTKRDILYDLGCGDGRFVITAAKKYGARGVGVDIDPDRIKESIHNARMAGVMEKLKFINGDLFETDIREATVVALYLLPEMNLELRPKLLKELKPGSRVLSYEYDMYEWPPDKMGRLGSNKYYYWVIPADVAGKWHWSFPSPKGEKRHILNLEQNFQEISGKIITLSREVSIMEAYVRGNQVALMLRYRPSGQLVEMRFNGRVNGNTINGGIEVKGGPHAGNYRWIAKRQP